MKHLYLSLLTLSLTIPTFAQQIPNSDFEGTWAANSCWTSNGSNNVGTTPEPWKISSVAGYKIFTGWANSVSVGSKVTGHNNSNSAVQLKNGSAMGNPVPAYLTLGTPWNTSNLSAQNKDGGAFGGYDFTYRPDAVSFYYTRSHASGSTKKATVVAYLWKGTYTQESVPGNIASTAKTVTMTDRDRHILNMETPKGGAKSQTPDAERIAQSTYYIDGDASNWTNCVVPLNYEKTSTPAKINIIFCATEYFSTDVVADDQLTVDDVKLLYYSRLASLTVDGNAVDGFDSNTYSYDLSATTEMPTDASAISYTCLGNSGSASANVTLDQEALTATIVVTNSNAGGTDIDGATSHTYTIKFKERSSTEWGGTVYNGYVTILKDKDPDLGLFPEDVTTPGEVHIIDSNDGTCNFVLPNFMLGEDNLGDIVVNNVTMTQTADGYSYEGSCEGLQLLNGFITFNVTLSGTSTNDGNADIKIDVIWKGESDIPIFVEFHTKKQYGGDVYTGIVTLLKNDDLGLTEDLPLNGEVHIINNGNGTCNFILPDFMLGEDNLGDIIVNNVTMTEMAGECSYDGYVEGLQLLGGAINANVKVTGTTDSKGNATMKIDVIWVNGDNQVPIYVTFNGKQTVTGIDKIEADNTDKPVEYYNLQGIRFSADQLRPGIYIRRQGTEVSKILIK